MLMGGGSAAVQGKNHLFAWHPEMAAFCVFHSSSGMGGRKSVMTMPYATQTIMPSRPIREPKTSHAMSAGKEKMRQQAHMGSDVAKSHRV